MMTVTTGNLTISNFSPGSKTKTDCHESYSCVFRGVPLTSAEFEIKIVDYDKGLDDPIGKGLCRVNATCQIGLATVAVKSSD